jgi:hypothetical protein
VSRLHHLIARIAPAPPPDITSTRPSPPAAMSHPLFPSNGAFSLGHQQHHAEVAFSSGIPATPDVESGAPCSEPAVPTGCADPNPNAFSSLLDVSLPQPQPLPPLDPETPIHLHEERSDFDFNFAGVLPATNVSLPQSTIIRTAHNLRLPSFDALGIASPHPDRAQSRFGHLFSPSGSILGAGPLSKPEDPLHALSPQLEHPSQANTAAEAPTRSSKAARAQTEHTISTFTPPSESGTFNWGALMSVRPAALGSPPSSDPGISQNFVFTASATAPSQAPIVVPTFAGQSEAVAMSVWVEEAKTTISKLKRCHA